jgi:hypothetical protein
LRLPERTVGRDHRTKVTSNKGHGLLNDDVIHQTLDGHSCLDHRFVGTFPDSEIEKRSGVVSSGSDILFITHWNANPRPFVWTNTADEILETLAAYCQRINDSGH